MDFLDPKKTRAHNIRLFIGYALIATLLAFSTLILFFFANGYDIDRKTGIVIQNGTLFFDALPGTAQITINGESKGQTARKHELPGGTYDAELKRDGYRPWQRRITLEGGTLQYFQYPFLFPTTLVTSDAQLYINSPDMTTQSPDNRWLIVRQPGQINVFDLYDLQRELIVATPLTVPKTIMSLGVENSKLEPIDWAADNRFVLIKHTFTGGQEFIVLDSQQPSQSMNVSKAFASIPAMDIVMRDKKFDKYFLHNKDTQTLYKTDLKSALTETLPGKIIAFKAYKDDVLLYVTAEGASEGNVNVNVREGDKTFTLRELPVSDLYLLDIERYENKWYVIVGSDKGGKVYVYREPVAAIKRTGENPIPATTLRPVEPPQNVSFSKGSRFVLAQGGKHFTVYDIEEAQPYRFELAQGGPKATWMDEFRMLVVTDNKVSVFDYDGKNNQVLVVGFDGFAPAFGPNYKRLFTVAPSVTLVGRAALTQTQLRTPDDQ